MTNTDKHKYISTEYSASCSTSEFSEFIYTQHLPFSSNVSYLVLIVRTHLMQLVLDLPEFTPTRGNSRRQEQNPPAAVWQRKLNWCRYTQTRVHTQTDGETDGRTSTGSCSLWYDRSRSVKIVASTPCKAIGRPSVSRKSYIWRRSPCHPHWPTLRLSHTRERPRIVHSQASTNRKRNMHAINQMK